MGIGTIFISTLALSKLPKPHNPPETQEEILSAYLQPIVSFIVLGSVMIRGYNFLSFNAGLIRNTEWGPDGLSVPFFSFGQNMSRSLAFSGIPIAPGERTSTAQSPIPVLPTNDQSAAAISRTSFNRRSSIAALH